MRRVVAVLAVSVLAGLASEASAGGLDLRIGAFFPRAESNLFLDDAILYTVDKGDWIGVYGGAEYSFGVADKVELGFHIDGYGRSPNTSYRDFVRPSGREITQTLDLYTIPVGMTLRFVPRTGRGEISPYIGVGPDVVFWQYEEFGDFIDFDDPAMPVIPDHFLSDGAAFGFHVVAGVRVPISYDFGIVLEGKYIWAKDDMGEDFRGNKIDLSGPSATLGFQIRF
jgi:outer membrane protein with beta-barrel domain